MLKLLRRKSFRKSKEFKPSSRTTLNSSSGSVSATCQSGGHYYLTRPHRSRTKTSVSSEAAAAANGASQNSLEDRKSISSHRYSSVNLGSPVPVPEIIQYSRPPENLTSPVRESLERPPVPAPPKAEKVSARSRIMNVLTHPSARDDTAARLRTGNVMPTPRCLPPTPKRASHHHARATGTPTAQALPMQPPTGIASPVSQTDGASISVVPKPSARMSLRSKVKFRAILHTIYIFFIHVAHVLKKLS
jgi:hypothetical protein